MGVREILKSRAVTVVWIAVVVFVLLALAGFFAFATKPHTLTCTKESPGAAVSCGLKRQGLWGFPKRFSGMAGIEVASWMVDDPLSENKSYTLLLREPGDVATHETLIFGNQSAAESAAESFNAFRSNPDQMRWVLVDSNVLLETGMVFMLVFLAGFVIWETRKEMAAERGPWSLPENPPRKTDAPDERPTDDDPAAQVLEPACPRCNTQPFDGKACSSCGGRLLPTAEVEAFMEKAHGMNKAELLELAGHFSGPKLPCPSCASAMAPVKLKGEQVDLCSGCGALWVDAGEDPLRG
jgi:Zn-finger nucleic acid-binding protein